MSLAEFLRNEMQRKHLSQSEMARRLDVYPNYVQRWIKGDKPRPEQCAKIADGLGLTANQVMQMAGHPVETNAPEVDPEKQAAVMAMERILDEVPRNRWRSIVAITRGVVQSLEDEIERDPEQHHGNADGRDNVKQNRLVAASRDRMTNNHGNMMPMAV